jgi:hypothetical protein
LLPKDKYDELVNTYLNAPKTKEDLRFVEGWDKIDASDKEAVNAYLQKEPQTAKMQAFHDWEKAVRDAVQSAYKWEFPDDFWDDFVFSDWDLLLEWDTAMTWLIGNVEFFFATSGD